MNIVRSNAIRCGRLLPAVCLLVLCGRAVGQVPVPGQLPNESNWTNQFGLLTNSGAATGIGGNLPVQPVSPLMGTSVVGGPGQFVATPGSMGPGIPLFGPFTLHPKLLETFLYGQGIEALPGQSSTTAIETVNPGVVLGIGQNWSINYSPSFVFYSNPAFKNTVNQNVLFGGVSTNADWALGLSQSYTDSQNPLVETGEQTEVETYGTVLNASHQLGSRTSVDLTFNQNIRIAEGLSSLYEWSTLDWFNYALNPQWIASLGTSFGYDNVTPGSAMPFEQALGKINFHPGEKLTVVLMGGVEDRQFIDPSQAPLISPIFNVSLIYSPTMSTMFTLAARRTVTPSFYGGEVETATTAQVVMHHEFSRKLSLELSAEYAYVPETEIVPGEAPVVLNGQTAEQIELEQETFTATTETARAELSYTITPRMRASIFYIIGQVAQGPLSYPTRQEGFSLSYTY